ncbi:MAG: FHA domain-containing protein, partial [Planctomycetota bacterium]
GVAGWEVVDLGSTNKTRVNGHAITRRVLAHGDVIEVGQARLAFEDPDEARREEEAVKAGVCFLEWANKDRAGERILLSEPRATFGRRETNTVVLDDRMASGHHCEIDRDLNGYTIRDLGSTNGTLVNGEPVSEALLVHGARIRIGNSRFAFKDPSMKDIEVELSQFEEDEGWGMMADIDLSRARGSKAPMLAAVLLFVAVAAGGWWLSQRPEGGATARAGARGGLVEDGGFESPDLAWSPADEERATVKLVPGQGRGRSTALRAAATGKEGAWVAYEGTFDVSDGRPLDLEAWIKGRGEAPADLVVAWRSSPTAEERRAGLVTPLERHDVVARAKGSWEKITARLFPPAWAREAGLGLGLGAGATAYLDDLRVERVRDAPPPRTTPVKSFKEAVLAGNGALDLMQNRIVLLTDVHPVARLDDGTLLTVFRAGAAEMGGQAGGQAEGLGVEGAFSRPDGEPVPARISWKTTEEGLVAEVSCPGAQAVGIQAALPASHVGGSLSVLGAFAPLHIPAKAGQHVEQVSRVLVGEAEPVGNRPATLLAFVQDNVQNDLSPAAAVDVVASTSPDLVVVRLFLGGKTGRFGIVTDFGLEQQEARSRLADARSLVRRAPARAFEALRDVAERYPFEAGIRDEALKLASEVEDGLRRDVADLEGALEALRIYHSPEALEAVRTKATQMAARYLSGAPASGAPVSGARGGALFDRVAKLVEEARQDGVAWALERATPAMERLERIVTLLADVESYRPIAAVYARAYIERYGPLAADSTDVKQRVRAMRERLGELTSDPSVREAVPPVPDNP